VTTSPTDAQQRVLAELAPILPEDAYLAGGVAVSLHCGHRESHDIDLFVERSDPLTLESALLGMGGVTIDSRAEGTLYATVHGVPVSILSYSTPLSASAELDEIPVKVASLTDLACMKLSAISKRGAARDFWDLYVILERQPDGLSGLLEAFQQKHPRVDIGHVVRSLAYFDDAEAEPRPRGMSEELWKQIRSDIERRVREL
jgi:hypothetical protein